MSASRFVGGGSSSRSAMPMSSLANSARRSLAFLSEIYAWKSSPAGKSTGTPGFTWRPSANIKAVDSPAPHRWVETDTSDMFLPDVVWEHNRWTPIVANKADRQSTIVADIVGLTCQPDRIVPLASLPDVEPGDSIAFLDTGAYQDRLACNFNALPRPRMVLVTGDRAEWIKRPETVADIFRRDVVPPRLTARQ